MSLTKKFLFILIAGAVLILVGEYFVSRLTLANSFKQININRAEINADRAKESLEQEISRINKSAGDWAPWDETYSFVLGKNENYIEDNVNENTLSNLEIDFMIFVSKETEVIDSRFGTTVDESKTQEYLDFIKSRNTLFTFSAPDSDVSGILRRGDEYSIVSAHPIVRNDYSGPIAGTLIFGRFLNEKVLENISNAIKLPTVLAQSADTAGYMITDAGITTYSTEPLLEGDGAVILKVISPREILDQGEKTVNYFSTVVFILSASVIGIVALLVRLLILKPIWDLEKASAQIAKGNFETRVTAASRDELGALGSSFNSMAASLQRYISELEEAKKRELAKASEIVKLKDEFVFVATHELKAPVTVINGIVEIIKEQDQNISGGLKEDLDTLAKAADRLNSLVYDLLEVSRADSGTMKLKLETVNISELVKEIAESFMTQAKEKNIELSVKLHSENEQVLADRVKLGEVLNNLISNAIKYNKEGGSVEISSTENDEGVQVSVADSGYGIPTEAQEKIFSKFFRAETKETQDVEGSGLGLFVSKTLVEKMGGKIWFSSREGQGSEFHFNLKKPS